MAMVYNVTDPPELFGQVATYRHDQASKKEGKMLSKTYCNLNDIIDLYVNV